MKRQRVPTREGGDFALLLFQHGQQRHLLFAGVVAGDSVVLLFFLEDFLANGQRVDVDRDGVVEEPEIGQPADQTGMGHFRPASEGDDGMIVAVHPETVVVLTVGFGVPAVLLDGQLRVEGFEDVVIESLGQRRIQEHLVVPVMVGIGHRNDASALSRENTGQHLVELGEFRLHLLQRHLVERRQRLGAAGGLRRVVYLARDVEDETLAAEIAVRHRLPVAHEPLVSAAFRPDVLHLLGFLLVTQQRRAIVRVAVELHL